MTRTPCRTRGATLVGRWLGIVVVGAPLAVAGTLAVNADQSALPPGSDRPVVWSELYFTARKLLLSASTTVSTSTASLDEARGQLRPPPEVVGVEPGGKSVRLVALDTDLPFGRSERCTTWLDPASGAALQSERLRGGRRPSWKLIRYTSEGFSAWRAEPLPAEREHVTSPQDWGKRSVQRVAWTGKPPNGMPVIDPYALIYLVSANRLDREGSRLELCLPSKERLVQIELVAGAEVAVDGELEELTGGSTHRRHGPFTAREVVVRAKREGSGEGAQDFGLMGIEDKLTVLVEEGTAIPLVISGHSQVGLITVRLRRVTLATPTRGGER